MAVWIALRGTGISFFINLVILKLIAVLIVAFWVALQYSPLIACMDNSLESIQP